MSDSTDVVSVERVIAAPADRSSPCSPTPPVITTSTAPAACVTRSAARAGCTMGSKFGMRMHLGIGYSTTNTVIEFEDGKRIAWQTAPGGFQGRFFGGRIWRYELEPADGGTLVRESWDISQEKRSGQGMLRM